MNIFDSLFTCISNRLFTPLKDSIPLIIFFGEIPSLNAITAAPIAFSILCSPLTPGRIFLYLIPFRIRLKYWDPFLLIISSAPNFLFYKLYDSPSILLI